VNASGFAREPCERATSAFRAGFVDVVAIVEFVEGPGPGTMLNAEL
jgi:hypothetical protein